MPPIKELKTARDVKQALIADKASWSVNERLLEKRALPTFRTGLLEENLTPREKVKPIDFKRIFEVQPNNPFILRRRIALDIVPKTILAKEWQIGSDQILQPGEGAPETGAGVSTSVDWRNRWGWPWITTIRDQNGCNACWVFAAVALVEAMVRIEHCVWPRISEGDVHKGMGKKCCDCGNSENALDWMKDHGAADPDCFAWPSTSSGCTTCGGSGGGPYNTIPYTPTWDRPGRSVRIPSYNHVGSVSDQKKWIDGVGPLITSMSVYRDFFSYGSGVYRRLNTSSNNKVGNHAMLVVGYDDSLGCWIVKNSWGTRWGESGYCRIAYGDSDIDKYAKIGLSKTNPDPWTKRRLHNGSMLESGNGTLHRNFELLSLVPGSNVLHWWRDNSASGFPWNSGLLIAVGDAAASPTLTSTTYDRNFEFIYLTSGHRLRHWWFEQNTGKWHDGGVFGPSDAAGIPGFIQANYGAPGNFEVVVRTADGKLNHWWRDGAGWHDGGRFGSNVAYSGPSLIQSHYGTKGNFELVCVLHNGQMQHWWRANDAGMGWYSTPSFGSGVSSPPCMIEGSYGAANEKGIGNFELCVAVGGKVQHWWRANGSDQLWRNSATFGHDVKDVVSLVEGSYGFNLEVIVLRTDNKLQHYWRDGAGWHEGPTFGRF